MSPKRRTGILPGPDMPPKTRTSGQQRIRHKLRTAGRECSRPQKRGKIASPRTHNVVIAHMRCSPNVYILSYETLILILYNVLLKLSNVGNFQLLTMSCVYLSSSLFASFIYIDKNCTKYHLKLQFHGSH